MNKEIIKALNEKINETKHYDSQHFIEENKAVLLDEDRAFAEYMRDILRKKDITQQEVFLQADIPERYGYKIIAQQKHTQQRDIILRICYAAKMNLEETQMALQLYKMPPLFPQFNRDALIMIAFKDRPGSVIELNSFLRKNQVEPLRSCGTIE